MDMGGSQWGRGVDTLPSLSRWDQDGSSWKHGDSTSVEGATRARTRHRIGPLSHLPSSGALEERLPTE